MDAGPVSFKMMYSNHSALMWHNDYLDTTKTVDSIAKKHNIKQSTMIRHFKRLGLAIRPSGFRANNWRGLSSVDLVRQRYLWFFNFSYKRIAKRKNLACTLTDDQFIRLVTSDCIYCNKSWKSEFRVVKKQQINMVTIDRIDSTKGYIESNCVPCCKRCNTIKMDMTYIEWIEHLKKIVNCSSFSQLSNT